MSYSHASKCDGLVEIDAAVDQVLLQAPHVTATDELVLERQLHELHRHTLALHHRHHHIVPRGVLEDACYVLAHTDLQIG